MRWTFPAATGLLGVVATIPWSGGATEPSELPAAATQRVTIGASCNGTRVTVWVDPWTAAIAEGDDVEWVMDQSSMAPSFSVRPKSGRPWPFVGRPPSGSKDNPGRSGAANQRGRHQYDILMSCVQPDGTSIPVVLDPEIIIGN